MAVGRAGTAAVAVAVVAARFSNVFSAYFYLPPAGEFIVAAVIGGGLRFSGMFKRPTPEYV